MDTPDSGAVLACAPDMFGGIIVESETLPADGDAFEAALRRSLETWKSDGVRLVWLGVPIQRAPLIPIAVAAYYLVWKHIVGFLNAVLGVA